MAGKEKILNMAHIYYALGIMQLALNTNEQTVRFGSMRTYYADTHGGIPEPYAQRRYIFDKAVAWLVDQGMAEYHADDFGPSYLVMNDQSFGIMNQLEGEKSSIFFRAANSGDAFQWTQSALRALERSCKDQLIDEEDFRNGDDEWKPLNVDRADESLALVEAKVDEAIEAIRSDNGYAASLPEERRYAIESLTSLNKSLRESSSTSFGFIKRYGLEPLTRVMERFGPSTVGTIVATAREALKVWLKNQGVKALEHVFPFLF